MSIATKTGDAGETALMYGKRVPKTYRRVEAYGTVDELNAALGLVRASTSEQLIRGVVVSVQKELVVLMGELAVADGFCGAGAGLANTARLLPTRRAPALSDDTFTISPEDFGLQRRSVDRRRDGPAENARAIRGILQGERNSDLAAARDLVVINAAAALYLADVAKDGRQPPRQDLLLMPER